MSSTKENIIQAALELFAQKGFEATSIREIALKAGVNSSTLYHYIKSKDDFLISIMKQGLGRLVSSAEELISTVETPEQRIAALVQLHVMAHGANRLSTLVEDTEFRALRGENKIIIRNLRKKYELIWRDVIQAGAKEGCFRKVENAKLTAFALLAMCTGIVHWYSPDGETPLIDISEYYANMALNLLGAERNGKLLTIHDLDLPDPTIYYRPNEPDKIQFKKVVTD